MIKPATPTSLIPQTTPGNSTSVVSSPSRSQKLNQGAIQEIAQELNLNLNLDTVEL